MIHLHVRSWFSFLAGGSSPEALARRAELGQTALALTDLHGVYGVVRFATACRAEGIRPLFGATIMVAPRLEIEGHPRGVDLVERPGLSPRKGVPLSPQGFPLVLLAIDASGYANLCTILTRAHANDRTIVRIAGHELDGLTDGLIALSGGPDGFLDRLLDARCYSEARRWLSWLQERFPHPERLFVEIVHRRQPGDTHRIQLLCRLAKHHNVPVVATNDVRYATPADFPRYDALTCVRLGITVGERHRERPHNDSASLLDESELKERIPYAEAFANTHRIADACRMELLAGEVTPPTALLPPGTDPSTYLRDLCMIGIGDRYPRRQRTPARKQLEHELDVVCGLDLAEFFLVVHEVVSFARSRGIRCAGRGSAANSIIAYLLGITEVDPVAHHLLFERFLHRGRKGMPDIDVDFDSERRLEVIEWMEDRFGIEHAAMTANVNTYRARAMREMMKVLGWDLETVDRGAKLMGGYDGMRLSDLSARRAEFEAVTGPTPLLDVLFHLVDGMNGCPRHLSLHNGGMVLSRPRLMQVTPVQTSANGVRQVQFDKDDVEALGLIKFDILGLRTLAVISEALSLHQADSGETIDLDAQPMEDKATFDLIRKGETMSVFQIESPGQWNLLSRVQPERFDDLIVEVALFRPGPLQGGMVNPYVERRAGRDAVVYLHPSMEPILKDTFGVILFQEQVLEVSHAFAGLTLEEADKFRSLMSKWRDPGKMEDMRLKFVTGAMELHGVDLKLAEEVFRQVASFVGYGFCRSHAAAFARTVFHTAWLKAHYPAAFMAAVLQHKPGFYPMNTVLEEAKHLGVKLLPVDAWKSGVRYTLESGAIRVPLTQVLGMSEDLAADFVLRRTNASTIQSLRQAVNLPADRWDALARAGAFDSRMPRRDALWQVGLPSEPPPAGQVPLFTCDIDAELLPYLEALSESLEVAWDFDTIGMTPRTHPVGLHRAALNRLRVRTIRDIWRLPGGAVALVGGLVIVAQRPPTAKGMRFLVIEDETGRLPVAITPPVFERFKTGFRNGTLVIEGRIEVAGASYRSLLARQAWSLPQLIGSQPPEELSAAVSGQDRGNKTLTPRRTRRAQ